MPGLNGLEFLRKVKELNRFVRTILMTAFEIEDKMFREYTKSKIINSFLQKPIRIHDLLKRSKYAVTFLRNAKEIPLGLKFL